MSSSSIIYSHKKSSPNPAVQSPTTPRTFQPSSYYAAAGLHHLHGSSVTNDTSSASSVSSGSHTASIIYPTQLPSDLSSASDSDNLSPVATGFVSRLTRRPSCKRSNSGTSGSKSNRSFSLSKQKRRESQVGELAQVETQLLPSLKDTIERMTHPSSPVFTANTPPTFNLPHLSTPSRKNSSTPRSQESNASISEFKPTATSALKPILKPPHRTPIMPSSAATVSPPVKSLRSVKSMNVTPKITTPNFSLDAHLTARVMSPSSRKTTSSSSKSRAYNSNPTTPNNISASSVPATKQSSSQLSSRIPTAAHSRRISRIGHQKLGEAERCTNGETTPQGLYSPISRVEAPWNNTKLTFSGNGDDANRTSRSGIGLGLGFVPLGAQYQDHPSLCAEEEPRSLFDDAHEDEVAVTDDKFHEPLSNMPPTRADKSEQERMRRKRREMLLAIVDGIQVQFDSNPSRESAGYRRSQEWAAEPVEPSVFQETQPHRRQFDFQNDDDNLSLSSGDGQGAARVADMLRFRRNNHLFADLPDPRIISEEAERGRSSRGLKSGLDAVAQNVSQILERQRFSKELEDLLAATPLRQSCAGLNDSEWRRMLSSSHVDRPSSTSTASPSKGVEIVTPHPRSAKRRSVSTPAPAPPAKHRSATLEGPMNRRGSSGIWRTGYLQEENGARQFLLDDREKSMLGRISRDERDSFDLPSSFSYAFRAPAAEGNEETIPRVESDSSLLLCGERWREDAPDEDAGESRSLLSVGAEKLFRALADESVMDEPVRNRLSPQRAASPLASAYSQTSIASTESSIPSVYEDDVHERSTPPSQRGDTTTDSASYFASKSWRSTLPPSTYHSLVQRYGEIEMRRQEIIWELCESEIVFVKRLRTIVRLFIKPLRMQDTASWIEGIPGNVTRLFDWLEDIMNLHVQISAGLREMQDRQYPVVESAAEVVRAFVSRLEVYQPYLVRVGEVAGQVADEVRNTCEGIETSDFGEFVMIQEQDGDCEGWNLETLLLEPVNRLAKYSEVFQTLWDLTPKNHADYLSTFSLVHSTEMIIRVLREVKVREEEYDLVKNISAAFEGLPSFAGLARRERRLLTRGSLYCLYIQDLLVQSLGVDDGMATEASKLHPQDRELSRRSAVLLNAINDWDAQRTEYTASSATSLNSYSASSAFSVQTNEHAESSSQSELIKEHENVSQFSHSDEEEGGPHDHQQSFSVTLPAKSKQSLVDVFVFTDLMLLATPLHRRRGRHPTGVRERWRLLDDVGIARILGVAESREVIQGQEESVFVLDLLPMEVDDLETGIISDNARITTIHLCFRGQVLKETEHPAIERRNQWLTAFHQCFQFTLRSLSFPSHSGKYLAHGSNVDLEADTRETVVEILNSGLPLPKSPSIQVEDLSTGKQQDLSQLEREERGWWAVRFRQVFREIQRQDVSLLSLDPNARFSSPVSGVFTSKKPNFVTIPLDMDLSISSLESISQNAKESMISWVP